MAKYQKKKIQDSENSGFGHYQEGVGGGASPKNKDPNQRAPGVNSQHRQDHNDTMQPRTNDGKFTYKSVNGQSIDPKYGPSRGKTVNPLLTEGQNGIYIDDVKDQQGNTVKEGVSTQFKNQKGAYWNKYKDKWYQKGGEAVLPTQGAHHKPGFTTRVSGDTIWNVAKRIYNEVTGEFGGDIKFSHQLGDGTTKDVHQHSGEQEEHKNFDEAKKGRSTQDEKAAKQKAQATGEEQYVIDQNTTGVRIKPKTIQPTPTPTILPSPAPKQQPSPTAPAQPGQQPSPTAGASATANAPAPNFGSQAKSKYSDGDLAVAKQWFSDNGISTDGLTVEELDSLIDEYFEEDDGSDDNNNNTPTEQNENTQPTPAPKAEDEEESEAEKKIKKMGFSD